MIKKTTILIGILCIGILCSCKNEDDGKGPGLGLNPKYLEFSNRGDTAIVAAQRSYFSVGKHPISLFGYINHARDTLYDGWIKVVTLPDLKEVKVIVYDNNTGDGRYYVASIDGRNNGENIIIFQSAK